VLEHAVHKPQAMNSSIGRCDGHAEPQQPRHRVAQYPLLADSAARCGARRRCCEANPAHGIPQRPMSRSPKPRGARQPSRRATPCRKKPHGKVEKTGKERGLCHAFAILVDSALLFLAQAKVARALASTIVARVGAGAGTSAVAVTRTALTELYGVRFFGAGGE
jgi:hypothetical protein